MGDNHSKNEDGMTRSEGAKDFKIQGPVFYRFPSSRLGALAVSFKVRMEQQRLKGAKEAL